MTNNFGRAVGVGVVGFGLLALVISAPAGDQTSPKRPAAAAQPQAELEPEDLGDRAAEEMLSQTGDRFPGATVTPRSVIERWAPASRDAARYVMERYGAPDQVAEDRLVWERTGAFRKTIVYRDGVAHDFPSPHLDVIEQFVEYSVPSAKYAALAGFDRGLHPDRASGLLSARGASETDNVISLNLADDIVKGRRSVKDARRAYAAVSALSASGKLSPYAKGLLFKSRALADADRP